MDMNELDEEKLRRAFQLEGTACANPCGRREHDNFWGMGRKTVWLVFCQEEDMLSFGLQGFALVPKISENHWRDVSR